MRQIGAKSVLCPGALIRYNLQFIVPLDITVLDLTRLLPGAMTTAYFVQHGAAVIKIEQPGSGDYARTTYAELLRATNDGKKSVAIDLKHPRGRELMRPDHRRQ